MSRSPSVSARRHAIAEKASAQAAPTHARTISELVWVTARARTRVGRAATSPASTGVAHAIESRRSETPRRRARRGSTTTAPIASTTSVASAAAQMSPAPGAGRSSGTRFAAARPDWATASSAGRPRGEEVLREDGVRRREDGRRPEQRERRNTRLESRAEPGGEDPRREDDQREAEQDGDAGRGSYAAVTNERWRSCSPRPSSSLWSGRRRSFPSRRRPPRARTGATATPYSATSLAPRITPITITSAEKTTLPAM